MNQTRRKKIADLRVRVQAMRGPLEEVISDLNDVLEGEREAFENMPESLQESERGIASQENIDFMEECVQELETSLDSFESVDTTLEEIAP